MGLGSNKLFVYGTLRLGFPLHPYMRKGAVRLLGKGKICGRLYDLGDFPGALPSTSRSDEIEGELYELGDAIQQLRELDEVEEFNSQRPGESLFVRRLTDVELATGQRYKAWAYFLPKKPAKARLIPSGDYAEVRRRT